MKLQNYIKTFPIGEREKEKERISSELGVSKSLFGHWCNGTRRIKSEHVLKIEMLTKGKVKRFDMRPDIYPPNEY